MGFLLLDNKRLTAAQQAGDVLASLPNVQITSASSGTQTDLIVDFGVLMPDGDNLASDRKIVMYDGETALTTQEDNRYSDRSKVRGLKATCVIPSLGAGVSKELTPKIVSSAPSSGADLTPAQVLALDSELEVVVRTNDGTARSASLRDALGASTTWVKGSAHYRGKFRSGDLVQEYICTAPQKTSGGTADGDLNTEFHISVFSADEFTSIKGARVDAVTSNGFVDSASLTERFVEASVEVGVTSPTTVFSYTSRTPSVQLDFTNESGGTHQRWAITTNPSTTGTFDINDHGKAVEWSGEIFTINEVSADGATAKAYSTSRATTDFSMLSGSWTVHGLRIPPRSQWHEEVWYGTEQEYWVAHKAGAVKDSRLILNYGWPSADIDLAAGTPGEGHWGLNIFNAQGSNPFSIVLGTAGNGGQINQSHIGERYAAGNEPDAIVLPSAQVRGILKVDASGYYTKDGDTAIYGTARRWFCYDADVAIDDNTGLYVHWNDRPTFSTIDLPSATGMRSFAQGNNVAHHESQGYIPFILSGKFMWLEYLQSNFVRYWIEHPPTGRNFNDGGNKRWPQNRLNQRGVAWRERTFAHAALGTPDSLTTGLLPYNKTEMLAWIEYGHEKAYKFYVDDGTGNSGWSNEASPGPNTHMDGPLLFNNNDAATAHRWVTYWNSYYAQVMAHQHELGLLGTWGEQWAARRFADIYYQFEHPDILSQDPDPDVARAYLWGLGTGTPDGSTDLGFESWSYLYQNHNAGTNQPWYRGYRMGALVLAEDTGLHSSVDWASLIAFCRNSGQTDGYITLDGNGDPDRSQFSTWRPKWQDNDWVPRT